MSYGTRIDLNAPAASLKTIIRGACLTCLTITCTKSSGLIPLLFDAQRLRDVYLRALKVDGLVIDEGMAQLGGIHDPM